MLSKVNDEQFQALDPILQSEYLAAGADGLRTAKIDPVDGLKLEDVTGLTNTVATLRTEGRTKDTRLKAFGDLDPVKAREALTTVKDLGGMTLSEKTAESVKQRETALVTKHNEEMKVVTDSNESLTSQLKTVLVKNVVVNELAEHDDKLILPGFIQERVSMRDNGQGKMIAVVLDEQGNEAIGDSQGNPMTVKQLVNSFRGDKTMGRYFGGTGTSGTGTTGTESTTGKVKMQGGVKTISSDDHAGITANQDGIANGTIVVVDPPTTFEQ